MNTRAFQSGYRNLKEEEEFYMDEVGWDRETLRKALQRGDYGSIHHEMMCEGWRESIKGFLYMGGIVALGLAFQFGVMYWADCIAEFKKLEEDRRLETQKTLEMKVSYD
tara:strand:- start:173 stop:499 length:327 start_codon:yes stop_codon:yes gene_type:complete